MITIMILIIIIRKPVIALNIKIYIYKEIIESDLLFVFSLPRKGIKITFKNY